MAIQDQLSHVATVGWSCIATFPVRWGMVFWLAIVFTTFCYRHTEASSAVAIYCHTVLLFFLGRFNKELLYFLFLSNVE